MKAFGWEPNKAPLVVLLATLDEVKPKGDDVDVDVVAEPKPIVGEPNVPQC